jgi:hypothetical protein
MTTEQINAATKVKVEKVEALMKELQLTVSPKEVVTKEGFIERVVYYMDSEAYTLDPK